MKIEPFEEYYHYYDLWFEEHKDLYSLEIKAIKRILQNIKFSRGFEVGIGTGRFSLPFGIKYGIDPSIKMLKIAKKKGLNVVRAIAEELPLKDNSLDLIMFVTTICFVDKPLKVFKEINRVLDKNGRLIVGFVDKDSELGRLYEKKRSNSKFYYIANFFTSDEVIEFAKESFFNVGRIYQTINPEGFDDVIEGYGIGSFVTMEFIKS